MTDRTPIDPEALLANAAWVQRLARRLVGDAHLAEDVAQEALTAALSRPGGFATPSLLRRWLAGATRHLAWRARAREQEQRAREARAARPEATVDDAAERLRTHRRLVDQVLALDEPYREALVLRFFDGLPPREIARRLGISPEAARQRVSRGLARLRARLDGESCGGRRAWCGALVALARGGRVGGSGLLTLEVGLVGIKTMVAAAGVIGLGLWWLLGGPAPEASPPALAQLERGTVELAPAMEGGPAAVTERVPAGGDAPAQAICRVRIVDESGALLSDVEAYWIVAGEGSTAAEVSDGLLREPARPQGATLLARAPGRALQALTLAERVGEHELVLTPAAPFSGTVRVDGQAPPEPLRLTFRATPGRFEFLDENLREAAGEAFDQEDVQVMTGAGGTFVVPGERSDWFGRVELPNTHWFRVAPEGAVLLEFSWSGALLPRPGRYLFELTRLPVVRGRLVWKDDASPLSDAPMDVHAQFEDGDDTPSMGLRTDEQGFFEIGLWPGSSSTRGRFVDPVNRAPIKMVQVGVYPPGGLRAWFQRSGDELGPDGDLGVFEVERGRSVHFLAVDVAGAPIAGARAATRTVSEPSGVDGRVVLRGVPPDTTELLLGAPGTRVVRVPLSAGATEDDPLRVVLTPGNRLALHFVGGRGALPSSLRFVLLNSEPLFEQSSVEGGLGPAPLHRELMGEAYRGGHWGADGGHLNVEFDGQGRAELFGLVDHVQLTIQVRDRLGQIILEQSLRGPGGGERLEHEVVLDAQPFTVTGRVVDERGAGLANAIIDAERLTLRSGRDGSFELSGLYAASEPIALEVILPGYASLRLEGLTFSGPQDLGDLVMSAGRTLRVEMVDEAGRPMDIRGAKAVAPGYAAVIGEDVSPGVERLLDVPPVPMELSTNYGWRRYTLPIAADQDLARFVLPVHGTLELSPPAQLAWPQEGYLSVRIHRVEEAEVGELVYFDQAGEHWTESLPLLPGRYAVRIEHLWWADGHRDQVTLPGSWEVEVRPGETTRRRLGG